MKCPIDVGIASAGVIKLEVTLNDFSISLLFIFILKYFLGALLINYILFIYWEPVGWIIRILFHSIL